MVNGFLTKPVVHNDLRLILAQKLPLPAHFEVFGPRFGAMIARLLRG